MLRFRRQDAVLLTHFRRQYCRLAVMTLTCVGDDVNNSLRMRSADGFPPELIYADIRVCNDTSGDRGRPRAVL